MGVVMKIIKRNAIILAAILFVCVAVYLNWAYNRQEETLSEPGARETVSAVTAEGDGEGLFYEAPVPAVSTASAVTARNPQRSSLLGRISDTRKRTGSTKDSTADKNT